MQLLTWIAAAAFAVAFDYVCVKYNRSIARDRVYQAMLWSALCPILSVGSIYFCLKELPAVIPTAVCCALGTWLAMRVK